MATEIVVGTQIQRVIEDSGLPNSLIAGVLTAVHKNEDIPGNIVEKLLRGIGVKGEQLYKYAAKGNYIHGIPSSSYLSMSEARAEVQTTLSYLESSEIFIEYCKISKPNYQHMTWMKLVSDYQYNPQTNQIPKNVFMNLTGHYFRPEDEVEIFLSDLVLVVPESKYSSFEPGVIDLWGTPATSRPTAGRTDSNFDTAIIRAGTPVRVRRDISTEYLELVFSFARPIAEHQGDDSWPAGSIKEVSHIIGPEVFTADTTQEYYQVGYKIGTNYKWWMYKVGSGVHPNLDEVALAPPEVNGTYFPFTYFRYEKKSESEDKTSREYKDAKKMAGFLGLDYDDVSDAINENPDIADVIQAFIMFGVDPDSRDPLDREYLYHYFDSIYLSQDNSYRASSVSIDRRSHLGFYDKDISDSWNNTSFDVADNRFRMRFKARGIFKNYKAGSITKVGGYNSGKGTVEYPVRYMEWDEDWFMVEKLKEVPYFYYQYQVSSNLYYEIQVVGLEMQYYVYGEHLTTSMDTQNILLVPLDRSQVESWPIPRKEQMYSRSLWFVFNSMQEIKLKWYQTGLGQILLAIVAVIISVIIQGTDGGSLVGMVMGAGITSIYVAIFIAGIIQFAINQLITGAIGMIGELLGAEGAIVAAVIAAIAALYGMYKAGTTNLPWAQQALNASSGLVKGGIQASVEDLMDEYTEFMDWASDAQKDLDEVSRTVTHNSHMHPFMFIGESPTDFYNRTIHAGNVGVIGVSAISSYVDNALQLPKIHETLGDSIYV